MSQRNLLLIFCGCLVLCCCMYMGCKSESNSVEPVPTENVTTTDTATIQVDTTNESLLIQ